jgi:hypothetical protein
VSNYLFSIGDKLTVPIELIEDLFAEGHPVEVIQQRLVKPLTDAVGLGAAMPASSSLSTSTLRHPAREDFSH